MVYASEYDLKVAVIGAANNSVIETLGAMVINPQTYALSYTGGMYNGSSPWGMAYVPSVGYLYIANQGSNNVTVVNCATNTIVGTITVGALPEGVAYDPANGYVYVANAASDTISIISPATTTAVPEFPLAAVVVLVAAMLVTSLALKGIGPKTNRVSAKR